MVVFNREIGLTRWSATTQSSIINMLNIKSNEPRSQGDILISILMQNMPEKLIYNVCHQYLQEDNAQSFHMDACISTLISLQRLRLTGLLIYMQPNLLKWHIAVQQHDGNTCFQTHQISSVQVHDISLPCMNKQAVKKLPVNY